MQVSEILQQIEVSLAVGLNRLILVSLKSALLLSFVYSEYGMLLRK